MWKPNREKEKETSFSLARRQELKDKQIHSFSTLLGFFFPNQQHAHDCLFYTGVDFWGHESVLWVLWTFLRADCDQ